MLTGRTPFLGLSEYLTFQRILQHCDGTEPIEYPPTISDIARDLIQSFLRPVAAERIGAGASGTANDMISVKRHPFFEGIDFRTLLDQVPPYIPDASSFPSTDNMQNGASDDWMFEGEATPIMANSYGSDDDIRAMEPRGAPIAIVGKKQKGMERWREI
jgi:serine/threonine protein kinase